MKTKKVKTLADYERKMKRATVVFRGCILKVRHSEAPAILEAKFMADDWNRNRVD